MPKTIVKYKSYRPKRTARIKKRHAKLFKLPRIYNFVRNSDCYLNGNASGNVNTNVTTGNGASIVKSNDGWYLNTGSAGIPGINYFCLSWNFTLDMLPEMLEFTSLFDQYKIDHVELTIRPFQEQSVSNANTVGQNPPISCIMYSVKDYDDSATFTPSYVGVNDMREYRTFKEYSFFQTHAHKIKIKPHMAVAAYGSGVFSSYANNKAMWIDSNSPSVQHYGIKLMFEVFNSTATVPAFVWFRPEVKVYFSCRQER